VGRAELLHALKRCVPCEAKTAYVARLCGTHQPAELSLLAMMLEQENYQVIQALGTAEATNLARCAPPDLVVTNLLREGWISSACWRD